MDRKLTSNLDFGKDRLVQGIEIFTRRDGRVAGELEESGTPARQASLAFLEGVARENQPTDHFGGIQRLRLQVLMPKIE